MSIVRTYQNYLKQEKQYEKINKDRMAASDSSASTGLLARRNSNNRNKKRNDNNSDPQQKQFESIYNTIQAIRNRNT